MPSEETEDADALQLIAEYWKKIGIKMLAKPQTRENFRLRTFSGEAIMTAYRRRRDRGADAEHQPQGVRADHAGRPAMVALGHVRRVQGQAGREVRHGVGLQAPRLRQGMGERDRRAGRRKAWEKILPTNADEVFSIGTVNGIRQPIVVGPKVRNVPKEGYYAWDPGGYIGLYQPDTFWVAP